MIHLAYSNRTEALFEHFATDLASWRGSGDLLFEPARLVVPNRNVETWLKRQLAARDGIAANFDVHFLRRFVGGLLGAQQADLQLVDSDVLVDLVLSVLLDEARLRKADLKPVRDYLRGGGDSADAMDLRRVQLAVELARLFEEYGFSRAEMLRSWTARPTQRTVPEGRWAALEAWQRAVWLEIFGPGGVVPARSAASGERFLTLPDVLDRLPRDALGEGRPVFLFGVSYVANLFQRVLAHLALRGELYVYTLNPCLEFWEDLLSGREVAARARLPRRGQRVEEAALATEEDPFHLRGAGDTPALELWGRPGRENIRLLDQLSDCDFHAAFEDPLETRDSLLAWLQRDILLREPERLAPPPDLDLSADTSVRVLACPGMRREAEAIASEIWSLLREAEAAGAALRFSDVAVLVAGRQPESYFTHLSSAFEERGFDIPFTLEAGTLAMQSPVAEVARLLLALPFGRFTRAEVLRVATHPAVAGRFEAEAAEWVRWCDELGIFHGADRTDHEGSYLEEDLHNWDQGLRRLALGAVMTGARSNDPRPFVLGGERYLPEEFSESSEGSATAFGRLVRSLVNDARFARDQRLTLPEWADLFARMLQAYVVPRNDRERGDLEKCLSAVRALADQTLDGQRVSCRIAGELAKVALGRLKSATGGKADEGVTVSTLQPMRALPFKVVFVVGLSEGRFPAADRKSELDLRGAQLRAGDVSAREQDQYMFLETLLCARERLYLSYVARHELTGEPLQPSPVVVELLRILDRGYLPGAAKRLAVAVPLRRFDPEVLPARPAPPEAAAEAQVLALRRSLGTARLDRQALRDRLPPEVAARAEAFLRFAPPPRAGRTYAPESVLRVRLTDLRRFLECPLQGAARFLLRLEEDVEDLALIEDEPFEGGRFAHLSGQRQVFLDWLRHRGARSFEALLEEWAGPRIASGELPAGLLWQVERPALLVGPGVWEGLLREADVELPRIATHGFGAAHEHERVDERHDPISLSVAVADQAIAVEIVGTTGPVFSDRAGELGLHQRSANSAWFETARQQHDSLGAFLDHVALSAAGERRDGFQSVNLYDYGQKAQRVERCFSPIAQDRARGYLEALVADLLQLRERLFPAEAVFYWINDQVNAPARQKNPCTFAAAVEEIERRGLFVSQYGPVRNARDYPAPDEAEARGLCDRRFGLYLETQSLAPEAGEEAEG